MTEPQQTTVYFATATDSGKIYPNLQPAPLPEINYDRAVSIKRCLPGQDQYGNFIPGNTRVFDAGTGTGSGVIELKFVWMENSKIVALQALYDDIAQIIYYDGTVRWLCSWESGRALSIEPIVGSKTGSAVSITLRVLGVY